MFILGKKKFFLCSTCVSSKFSPQTRKIVWREKSKISQYFPLNRDKMCLRKISFFFFSFQWYTRRCSKYVLLDSLNVHSCRRIYEKTRTRSTVSRRGQLTKWSRTTDDKTHKILSMGGIHIIFSGNLLHNSLKEFYEFWPSSINLCPKENKLNWFWQKVVLIKFFSIKYSTKL